MFRFKKNCRLHNFKLIRSLKESGEIFYSSDVLKDKCFVTEKNNIFTNLSEIQILITVPKKIFKRAVDRNLIKRRIREIFRLNRDKLKYYPKFFKTVFYLFHILYYLLILFFIKKNIRYTEIMYIIKKITNIFHNSIVIFIPFVINWTFTKSNKMSSHTTRSNMCYNCI